MTTGFWGMIDRQKQAKSFFQPEPFSDSLTIANLQHARFESTQKLTSDLNTWNCWIETTTKPRQH